MFIAGLILFLAESLFLVYLIRKQKNIAKREKAVIEKESVIKLERESLNNLKIILDEDYARDLENKKTFILNEFADKLYEYHTTNHSSVAPSSVRQRG